MDVMIITKDSLGIYVGCLGKGPKGKGVKDIYIFFSDKQLHNNNSGWLGLTSPYTAVTVWKVMLLGLFVCVCGVGVGGGGGFCSSYRKQNLASEFLHRELPTHAHTQKLTHPTAPHLPPPPKTYQ